ncbi:hypothetical protein [Clostridium sp. Marseille-Q2269]|uniref:hypothetical protein n=1 Tax=Clostridium sp. Marseille-Q2269 TaxID=2942205 RepID=UPI00207475FE|nr:hypothetical protein [Clostridium sp. Marseille-Q2269]
MLNKKNEKLKKVLTTATVLTILVANSATQAFASNDTNNNDPNTNTAVNNESKTPVEMVNEAMRKVYSVISTENLIEMNKVLNDVVQVRRDLVKKHQLNTWDPLVVEIKNKTQSLRKRITEVTEIKVEREQKRLSNTYKNSESIPLVQNPNWYNSGLPEKVKVREVESSPDVVIIDIIAQEDKEIKDGICYDANAVDYFESTYKPRYSIDLTMLAHTKIEGYMDKDGNVYKDAKSLPDGYYKKGDVLYSVLINANDPMVKGTKVINRSYWQLCIGTTLGKNQSTNLTKDTTYGVDKGEAISIAKTAGTSLSISGNIGASKIGTGSGTINYTIQDSLTKTFSRTISVSQKESDNIRHVFEKGDTNRKVGLYQFVETFEQIPNSQYNENFGMKEFDLASHYTKDNGIEYRFNRTSEVKTREFTAVDIEEGQATINSGNNIK